MVNTICKPIEISPCSLTHLVAYTGRFQTVSKAVLALKRTLSRLRSAGVIFLTRARMPLSSSSEESVSFMGGVAMDSTSIMSFPVSMPPAMTLSAILRFIVSAIMALVGLKYSSVIRVVE